MTVEQQALLQGVIDTARGQFVRTVSEGRTLPIDGVRKVADGRIMTSEQALPLKLVDRLGVLQDAMEEAGRLGGGYRPGCEEAKADRFSRGGGDHATHFRRMKRGTSTYRLSYGWVFSVRMICEKKLIINKVDGGVWFCYNPNPRSNRAVGDEKKFDL